MPRPPHPHAGLVPGPLLQPRPMKTAALIPDADRLDQWLVAHGHAATRREAQAAIMAGLVTVDGQVADKPGRRITPRMQVAVQRRDDPYASRGGAKLAHALAVFGVDVRDKVAVDLGASTGGFTDCLHARRDAPPRL